MILLFEPNCFLMKGLYVIIQVLVIHKTMEALNTWFESIGLFLDDPAVSRMYELQVSFHLPLHR